MIGRRSFVAAVGGTLTALSGTARGQQAARLAWIAPGTPASEAKFLAALREGLADNGLSEGRDYVLDVSYAEGDYRRFPSLTQEALAQAPKVLLVVTAPSVRVAQQATKTTPIVFMSTNDPVGAGLIDSLASPGGNTTGVATMVDDAAPKLVEMLHAVLPEARRAVVMINPKNVTNRPIFERMRAAGAGMGLDLRAVEVAAPEDIDGSLGPPSAPQPDAILIVADAVLTNGARRIATLGIERRIAVLGPGEHFAEAGALLGYGPSYADLVRRSAYYVKRILAGAQPRDLPVEQPTTFSLVINLETAKALGLTVAPAILARADKVIE